MANTPATSDFGPVELLAEPPAVVSSESLSWRFNNLAIAPKHLGSWGNLARSHQKSGQYEQAAAVYREALAAGSGHWFLLRSVKALANMTYDSGRDSQRGDRDAEIDAAPGAAPATYDFQVEYGLLDAGSNPLGPLTGNVFDFRVEVTP